MIRNIPYKYYKCLMVAIWAFSLLCIIGTWIGFAVGGAAAVTYAVIVYTFLAVSLIGLTVLFFLNGRPDYKVRAWVLIGLTAAHLVLLIVSLVLNKNAENFTNAFYAAPAVHTIILCAIVGLSAYFALRGKFVFKDAENDAIAAFGGPIDSDKGAAPVAGVDKPAEPAKPARDEKTGIVSL